MAKKKAQASKETKGKKPKAAAANPDGQDGQPGSNEQPQPDGSTLVAEAAAAPPAEEQGEAADRYYDEAADKWLKKHTKSGKLAPGYYEQELLRLQEELVELQYWVKETGARVAVVFEGRDAAGKGGIIKRIVERTNPRVIRVVALGIPTEREKAQWYFQRWAAQLPAGGEVALFDRSWYTRAITEQIMGFCTEAEYREFLRSCPQFERMLIRSGMILLKYWFSVSDEVQERRFQQRARDPRRRWKLSPMDIEGRNKWVEYSKAKDRMFEYTDTKESPWYVVNSDDKDRSRLNCISHLLSMIPYEDIMPGAIELPPRAEQGGYIRPPMEQQTFVPGVY